MLGFNLFNRYANSKLLHIALKANLIFNKQIVLRNFYTGNNFDAS